MSALIVDTETTGLADPVRPVEIAWLRLSGPVDLEPLESFSQRYDPDKAIEYGALATHHITAADLVGKPLWDTFRLPKGTEYLIGHNVDFDWRVLGEPPVKRICTLALARSLWPTLDSHTQGALLYHCAPDVAKEALRGAHAADADCWCCRRILAALIRDLGGIESWEALWKISEAARVPTVMAVGKHKGTPIAELPRDYVAWFLRQPDVDPYLRKALEGARP